MTRLNTTENYLLMFVVLWGGVLRAFYLDQPMRFDEAATFFNYVNNNLVSLFNYSAPNNHVLNSVLAKITTSLWGNYPAIIRLPAFLFGIGSIFLAFMVCRAVGLTGWFAAMVMASHPYLILFSTNARGYSGFVFFTLLFILQGLRVINNQGKQPILVLSVIGSIGLFNIPIMLFPMAGVALWICLQLTTSKPSIVNVARQFVIPFTIYSLIGVLLLYSPVVISTSLLNGGFKQAFQMLFNNEFVIALDWTTFFGTLPAHVKNIIRVYTQGLGLLLGTLIVLFALLGCVSDYLEKRYVLTQLLFTTLFATILIFLIKHTFPYPRTWIFFIPIFALIADNGFNFISNKLTDYRLTITIATLTCMVLITSALFDKRQVDAYADTGVFLDAAPIAKHINHLLGPEDILQAPIIPSNLPLYFYLEHEKNYHPNKSAIPSKGDTYIFMPNAGITLEMFSHQPHPINTEYAAVADGKAVKVFEFNGSRLYKLEK